MRWQLLLQISRPGLWLVFIWLYVWPTGGRPEVWRDVKFWAGLIYCTFPLNLLVYGFNDMVDRDTDRLNKRKGNYVFGAKASKKDLASLPQYMSYVNGAFLVLFICLSPQDGLFYILWFACAVLINALYNVPPFALARRAPFEIPCMVAGHFLIPILSTRLAAIPLPGLGSWLYHACLLVRSHVWLELMDINEDSACGKMTTAVVIGKTHTLTFIFGLIALESFIAFKCLTSLFGIFSLFGGLVLGLLESKGWDKKIACVSQSLVGFVLMVYVWISGDLVRPA